MIAVPDPFQIFIQDVRVIGEYACTPIAPGDTLVTGESARFKILPWSE